MYLANILGTVGYMKKDEMVKDVEITVSYVEMEGRK